MKRLIFGFLILLLAVGIGFLIHRDAGYILIAYNGWTLETSIWFGLICLIILFIVFYILLRLLRHTRLLGSKLQRWGLSRKSNKSRKMTNVGLCALAEGNWEFAESQLIKSAKDSNTPLINYLAAARAAQELRKYDRRDNHLRQAIKSTECSELAVGLTQAQLQINSQQWEQALATLKHLNQISPNHVFTLKLLQRVYFELQDWKQLQALLPSLRKYRVLNEQKLENTEEKIYMALLEEAAQTKNPEELESVWNGLPKSWRQKPKLVALYARYLIDFKQDDRAIQIIETTLKKQWDSQLIEQYSRAKGSNPSQQLATAENWQKKFPQEPELLLCLGKLAFRENFIGKAKEFFEDYLRIKPTANIYQQLALIHEKLGNTERALQYYRQASQKS